MRTPDDKPIQICDIGSKFGDSVRAWTTGSDTAFVHSYDLADVPEMIASVQPNGSKYSSKQAVIELYKQRVKFHKVDLNKSPADLEICLSSAVMLLDVEHQPVQTPMEYEVSGVGRGRVRDEGCASARCML